MTPREIVSELDRHIVGQAAAKKAVAIALRNRWRRQQTPEAIRAEITPKNILMIGPTGVGKTEIARRLAKLANAPFVKVEATKFTEVGYVGRDVDSIIRELADVAVKLTREQAIAKMRDQGRGRRRGAHPRCAAAAAVELRRSLHASRKRERRGPPGVPQEAARRPARRHRDRAENECRAADDVGDGPAWHGGNDQPAAGDVQEPRATASRSRASSRFAMPASC